MTHEKMMNYRKRHLIHRHGGYVDDQEEAPTRGRLQRGRPHGPVTLENAVGVARRFLDNAGYPQATLEKHTVREEDGLYELRYSCGTVVVDIDTPWCRPSVVDFFICVERLIKRKRNKPVRASLSRRSDAGKGTRTSDRGSASGTSSAINS